MAERHHCFFVGVYQVAKFELGMSHAHFFFKKRKRGNGAKRSLTGSTIVR